MRIFRLSPTKDQTLLSDYNCLELLVTTDKVENTLEELYCKTSGSFHVVQRADYQALAEQLVKAEKFIQDMSVDVVGYWGNRAREYFSTKDQTMKHEEGYDLQCL